jgi:hypothetical protein
VRAGPHPRAVEPVRDGLVEHLVDERRLARARHARDAAEHAERDPRVDALEVVLGRPEDVDVPRRPAPALGRLDPPCARQVLARQRLRDGLDVARRALGDDMPTVLARARPDVDQVVGGAHRALVVLDHEHGVAEVAQPHERRDQALVVALVQADRWLVEDVEHADQRRPDLGREPDPLRLAARQRRRRPVHAQVADADVVEELQPLLDLAQDQPRDRPVGVAQLERRDPLERAPRAHPRELVDRHARDLHGA